MGTFIVVVGMVAFSYLHARASRQDASPNNNTPVNDASANCENQPEGCKSQSPFVLWESLTRNLLISRR
jgi:hypothetical protein